jgi:hypothetical protein
MAFRKWRYEKRKRKLSTRFVLYYENVLLAEIIPFPAGIEAATGMTAEALADAIVRSLNEQLPFPLKTGGV